MGLYWVPTRSHDAFPPHAVIGGRDSDGSDLFVGRATHDGDLIPAKIIPSKKIAYISYNGHEIAKHDYEVLCGHHAKWEQGSHGNVPHNAFPGGRTASGETLYIGRFHHHGSDTVGKIHCSHRSCYIAYNGGEVSSHTYEVLCETFGPGPSAPVGPYPPGPIHGGNYYPPIHPPYQPPEIPPYHPGIPPSNPPYIPPPPEHHMSHLHWAPTRSHDPFPANGIIGGRDADGADIFVGRALHDGDLIPGKVIPHKKHAYVSYRNKEHKKHEFEVLCGNHVRWEYSSHGRVPPGAFPGGRTSNGETLYIGRFTYHGTLTVGKVHPSNRCCYIAFNGKEIESESYEVLIGN